MKTSHRIFTSGCKLFIPFIIFQLSFLYCFSSGGWVKDITNKGFLRAPVAITAADGGYLLAGYGNTDSTIYPSYPLLLKVDANGDEVWKKSMPQFGTMMLDAMVQQTTDGGFILAAIGNNGHFILKVDAEGKTVWMHELDVATRQIKQTADGGYIVTASASTFPPGWSMIKLDADGLVTWQKFYRNSDVGSGLQGASIDQTADGGYIVGGSWIDVTVDSGFYINMSYPAVIRVNAAGDTLWSKVLSNEGGTVCYVEEAAGGGYYVNGTIGYYQFVKLDEYATFDWGLNDCIFPSGFTFVETPDTAVVVLGHDGTNTIRKITADGIITIWKSPLGLTGRSVQQAHDGGFIITADNNVNGGSPGSTLYLIKTDSKGDTTATVIATSASAPSVPTLMGAMAYPNPFNDALHVNFRVPVAGNVTVTLFNMLGEAITLSENEYATPGIHTLACKPSVPPGVYLLEIISANSKVVQRVVKE